MRLVLLGAPGTGKGTQAALLQEKFDVPHISTGEMFRDAVAENTEVGKAARQYMDSGKLVPDSIVMGIVRDRLRKPDTRKGFLFDGFPRTVAQAKGTCDLLDELNMQLDAVLYIKVDEAEIIRRLSGRRTCAASGRIYNILLNPQEWESSEDKARGYTLTLRDDDREDVVQKRLDVYREQTAPLVQYYGEKGLLREIEGDGTVKEVFDRMISAL
jgi:adenylate kinase